MQTLVELAAVVSIVTGVALVFPPAAFVVAGVFLLQIARTLS